MIWIWGLQILKRLKTIDQTRIKGIIFPDFPEKIQRPGFIKHNAEGKAEVIRNTALSKKLSGSSDKSAAVSHCFADTGAARVWSHGQIGIHKVKTAAETNRFQFLSKSFNMLQPFFFELWDGKRGLIQGLVEFNIVQG